ncbi:MAG: hypothetical protein WAN35_16480 [Terracidiphilus sp.]
MNLLAFALPTARDCLETTRQQAARRLEYGRVYEDMHTITT